jgi:hypothetical protein
VQACALSTALNTRLSPRGETRSTSTTGLTVFFDALVLVFDRGLFAETGLEEMSNDLPEADFWPLDCASLNFRVARQALTASGGVQSQSLVVASEDARETPRAA